MEDKARIDVMYSVGEKRGALYKIIKKLTTSKSSVLWNTLQPLRDIEETFGRNITEIWGGNE